MLYGALIVNDPKFWHGLSPGIGSDQLDRFGGGYTGRRSQAINLQVRVSDPEGLSSVTEIRFAPNTRANSRYKSCEEMTDRSQKWRCHNLPENLPHPLPTTSAADRLTLPDGLLQPKANYQLIMRDEFDGNELDSELWRWSYNENLPTLRDGKLSFLLIPRLAVKSGKWLQGW